MGSVGGSIWLCPDYNSTMITGSKHDVYVRYVEKGNTSNVLRGYEKQNLAGSLETGVSFKYGIDSSVTKGGKEYKLAASQSDSTHVDITKKTVYGEIGDSDVYITVEYSTPDIPHDVYLKYVDYDTGSTLVEEHKVKSDLLAGTAFSFEIADQKSGTVTYYKQDISLDGGNPTDVKNVSTISNTMQNADMHYVVRARRKYTLTIKYVELNNESNELKDPTVKELFYKDSFDVTTPETLTKAISGKTRSFTRHSRNDGGNAARVQGQMPQDNKTYIIRYTMNHIIQTEVTNGRITTNNNGDLSPDAEPYSRAMADAYTDIKKGENREVKYRAKSGYLLDYVKVDGADQNIETSNRDSWMFKNIQKDYTISVKYVNKNDFNTKKAVKNDDGVLIDRKMVVAGDTLTYEISFKNAFSSAKTFVIKDVIPQYTSFKSADNGGTNNNGTVEWTLANVPAGGERKVTFKVTVLDTGKGKIIPNKATVAANGSTLETNEVENPVLTDPVKELKNTSDTSIDNTEVPVGKTLCYSITFKNPAHDTKRFTVTDKIEPYQTLIQESISDGGTVSNSIITWTLDIPAGESKTVTFRTTTDTEDKKIPNQAKVAVDNVSLLTNTTRVWTPKPVKTALNAAGVNINGKAVKLHDEFYYEIDYKNMTEDIRDYTVTDTLADCLKFVEAGHVENDNRVKGGSNASANGQDVKWTFRLNPGESKKLYLKVELTKTNITFSNKAVIKPASSDEPIDSTIPENWSGQIVINAEIEKYYAPFGQPSFMYKIVDKNGRGDTWRRMIIIDTNTRKGQAIFDIPTGHDADTWVVSDITDTRYEFVKATPETENVTVNENVGNAAISKEKPRGVVDYLYKVTEWNDLSHLDAVINTKEYKRG